MKRNFLIFLTLLVFVMTGCGNGIFSSGIDSTRDEHGNVILLDTPNNWDNWVMYIDLQIADESSGKKAPGGMKTWEEFWNQRIILIEDGRQENHQKYINYILEKRQQAGLPQIRQ